MLSCNGRSTRHKDSDSKTDETEGKTSSPATRSDGWSCPPRLLLCCRRKTGSYVTLVRQVTLAARQSFFSPLLAVPPKGHRHWQHTDDIPRWAHRCDQRAGNTTQCRNSAIQWVQSIVAPADDEPWIQPVYETNTERTASFICLN